MRKVAVTGGLASGKTTVCNYLRSYGAYVVSADEIVHYLLSHDQPLRKRIIAAVGEDCLKDGEIDRSLLAHLAFTHPEKLKALESLLHPEVLNRIETEYENIKHTKTYLFFVAEVPLLFECGWESHFDTTLCVSADETHLKKRQGTLSLNEIEKRMHRQLPLHEKQKRADWTIFNNSSLHELHQQVKKLIPQLIN